MRDFLEADRVVSLTGKISIDDEKLPAIIVDKIFEFTLNDDGVAREQPQTYSRAFDETSKEERVQPKTEEKSDADKKLWLNVSGMISEDVEELMETLTFYAGETVVYFVKDGKKMLCSQRVNPNRALMAELRSFLPENAIKLV